MRILLPLLTPPGPTTLVTRTHACRKNARTARSPHNKVCAAMTRKGKYTGKCGDDPQHSDTRGRASSTRAS